MERKGKETRHFYSAQQSGVTGEPAYYQALIKSESQGGRGQVEVNNREVSQKSAVSEGHAQGPYAMALARQRSYLGATALDASTVVKEKLKDITDCPICLETYKKPKILPCIHTFCMHCLRETGKKLNKSPGDTMPCPICRKEFTIPDTGFEGLQKNFFMNKLTEIKNILQPSSAQNVCDACREDSESLAEAGIPSAEMYCIECRQRLCGECHRHHRKNRLTKNHKLIATGGQHDSESENVQETLKADFCDKHQTNLLEIYCSGCQEVACAICFVEDHQAHVGSDINKVAADFRKEIKMNVAKFSSFLPQLRQEEVEMDKYKDELMLSTKDIQAKVNKRRSELKELVDKDADSVLLELESMRQRNQKKYELNKENIDTLLVCLDSYASYCLNLTETGSSSDVCRSKNALDTRARELRQLNASTGKSSQLPRLSFTISDLQDQNIIGTVEELGMSMKLKIKETTCMSTITIDRLNNDLDMERRRVKELERERDLLSARMKDIKVNELKVINRVRDLEGQVVLLTGLVHGGGDAAKSTGAINWKQKLRRSMELETFHDCSLQGYRVFGIAILGNEIFVASNNGVVVIHDLTTLEFKRRWKLLRMGETIDDVKQCNVNKCLYLVKVDSKTCNEIIKFDLQGNELSAWSIVTARGQLSVTRESNILLTVSTSNQLQEYAPGGKLIRVIQLPWSSGIDCLAHAIKLTSDHFLICHGTSSSLLIRVCIITVTGDVVKSFGEPKGDRLWFVPSYMDIDKAGNILVLDGFNGRALVLSSNLEFQRNPSALSWTPCFDRPKKILIDESHKRVFVVESCDALDQVRVYNFYNQ